MEYWLKFAHWVYSMQTLIAGALATVAALFTIRYLRSQIQQNETFRIEDLNSRHAAAKIEALWGMLELAKYNDDCLEYIETSNLQKNSYKHVEGDLGAPPQFPNESIPILANLIIGSDSSNANKIKNYIGLLQVRQSRLRSLRNSLGGRQKSPQGLTIHEPHAIHQTILDHYILKYETNRVLGYCRGDYANIPDLLTLDDAKNEISKFPDLSIDPSVFDYVAKLWPKDGWWEI